MLNFTPLHAFVAARVDGMALVDTLTADIREEIKGALRRYSVLIFPNQAINDEQQIRFTQSFGPLETTKIGTEGTGTPLVILRNFDDNHHLVSTDHRQNLNNRANQLWHTDSSFKSIPAHASILSAREVPLCGGDTHFVSMRAVYRILPNELKARINGRYAIHSYATSRDAIHPKLMTQAERETLPPVRQPMVLHHGNELGPSLYLGSHVCAVEGFTQAEGQQLIRELMDFATQPEFVFTHQWTQYDLVMWDNRAVIHRATPYLQSNDRRHMVRSTIAGTPPTSVP